MQCVAPNTIVNNSVNQPPPGPPSAGVRPYSTAGGRVLWSTQPAPLLVLAGCGPQEQAQIFTILNYLKNGLDNGESLNVCVPPAVKTL